MQKNNYEKNGFRCTAMIKKYNLNKEYFFKI